MNLRSQSIQQSHKSKPISIRQIMNQHVSMMQNNERILPPSLTDPSPTFPSLKPQAIANQALKMGMPITPPSHIQSETSVQLSDYQDPITQKMPSQPRRIKIFDINSYHGRNYPQQNNPVNPIKNAFSFGSQNPYQPINPVTPNQNQNISKNYSVDPSQNKSSTELYHTVRSMKKTVDNRNNTVYEQSLSNKQPSGILLRSNKFPGGGPSLRDSNSFSNPPPILKQTTSQYAPPILQPKRSTQYQSIRPPSVMNSSVKKQNTITGNPLSNLSRSASPSPVPVYQNQFHKINRSGDSFDSKKKPATYQNYNSKPMDIPQTPNFQKSSPYLDAILQDFNKFQARQRSGQRNFFSTGGQSNSIPNNIEHPPALQQALLQSFGHNSMASDIQHPPALQQALLQSFGQNSGQPSQPSSNMRQNQFNHTRYPPQMGLQPEYDQYRFLNNNKYQPINQLIAQQFPSSSPPPTASPLVSMSPFQQNQREQLRQIPRRFELIQKKVLQHQKQIQQIDRRLSQTKTRGDEAQKNLLGQLIQKQQELNQKQRQINSNLERISKMQNENNLKKQQILQYELQLQRARRVEELSKQNQRLYHELIRKENSNISNTRDMSLPMSMPISVPTSAPMSVPMSMPMSISSKPSSVPFSLPVAIQPPKRFRNEYSNRSISALQAQRFDQIWESDGGSIGSLLSPFSINPDYY